MEGAIELFRQVYEQHYNIEVGIAELKRKGYTQTETVETLMEVFAISLVESDKLVQNSLTWQD